MPTEKLIDLHAHTTKSDGSHSPTELIEEAARVGLTAVAVTDHDTIEGLEEALEAGRRLDMEVVTGIEFSVEAGAPGTCHLLGLLFDHRHPAITGPLERITNGRDERNRKIVNKLNELGLEITMAEVAAVSKTGQTGRPHIGQVLVDKGYVKNLDKSMEKYLGKNGPAYFNRFKLTIEAAIEAIRRAGGLAVLAHPYYLDWPVPVLDEKLEYFKSVGLGGIEVYYPKHDSGYVTTLEGLARKHDLLLSGGSDFHGSYKPAIALGFGNGRLRIGYDLLEKMKARLGRSSGQPAR